MEKSEIDARTARLSGGLNRLGAEAAMLTRRQDVYYFSGFTGDDAVLLLTAERRIRRWLVTDSRYAEEAEKTAPGCEVVLWKKGMAACAGALCKRLRLKRIGYSPASATVAFFNAMSEAAPDGTEWMGVDEAIGAVRSVKSAWEVKAILKALACAETAFAAAKRRWRAGMTEREVKNDLEWEMRRLGADDAAFETIVASGANASLPHAHAGSGKIAPGRMVLVDFGARVGFYHSDLTRTLWPGDMPARWRRRYEAVLAAQDAALAATRDGAARNAPDAAARNALAEHGLDERFIHGLGHGVGLEVHEEPRIGKTAKGVLAAGNIVTVEPGIYFPGSGGIRVEDMALIEKEEARILGSLPRDCDAAVF